MCVIAVKPAGVPLPPSGIITKCFVKNPHGAGVMFTRCGSVEIHKGFMDCADYLDALESYHLDASDTIVYHFRIATHGGICPDLTQPFPLTDKITQLRLLDTLADYGIAHNGIIKATADSTRKDLSDTAEFILRYLGKTFPDIEDKAWQKKITSLIGKNSRMAILGRRGKFALLGKFTSQNGIFYSNDYWM